MNSRSFLLHPSGFCLPLTGALAAVSAWLPGTTKASFPAEFELRTLNGTNGFKIYGEAASDELGRSVSAAGDVNGDGLDDLIIGAHLASDSGASSGASYLVFGSTHPFGASLDLSTLDGTNGLQINGAMPDDRLGRSVNAAGDVNGDGLDDLIIGADGADPNGISSGASYVIFGTTSAFDAVLNVSTLNGSNGFQLNGEEASDLSGISVSGAGDVNADRLDDLIIGALFADPNGSLSGASYVVFGRFSPISPSIELSSLDGTNGFRLNGEAAGDLSGRNVSAAGDFNGDGIDDLIIGASRADSSGTNSGASYVVFGTTNPFGASFNLSGLDGTLGLRIPGEAAYDGFGFSVSAAGDVNGDGPDDLIIGAYRADPNGTNSGASYVIFGATNPLGASLDLSALDGTNGFRIDGEAANDFSGFSVSGAGDVNGDGLHDLIIGALYAGSNGTHSGATYVVFGSTPSFGARLNLSALDGTNGFRIHGQLAGDRFGYNVSGAGDVSGDGVDDLIVGADRASLNGPRSGASYVVFGRSAPRIVQAPGPIAITVDEDSTLTAPPALGSSGSSPLAWSNTAPTNGMASVTGIGPAPASFTYWPATNDFGQDSFTVTVSNAFGTAAIPISVTVNPINDPPNFALNRTILRWPVGVVYSNQVATNLTAGPPNESAQSLGFSVSNDAAGLFSLAPGLDPSGHLTFRATSVGAAILSIVLSDNGGTLNGGLDRSAPQQLTLLLTNLPSGTASGSTTAGATSGSTSAGTTSGSNTGSVSAGSSSAGATSSGGTGSGLACANALSQIAWQVALKRPKDPQGKGVRFAPGKRGLGTLKGFVSDTGLEKKSTAVQVEIALLTSNQLAAFATNPCATPIPWAPAAKIGKINKLGNSKFSSPKFAPDAQLASGETFEIWLRASTNLATASSPIDRNPFRIR